MKEGWTTENGLDLCGRVIVVTGANSAIGFESAGEFARKGARASVGSKITQVFLIYVKETRRYHIPPAKCPVFLELPGRLKS